MQHPIASIYSVQHPIASIYSVQQPIASIYSVQQPIADEEYKELFLLFNPALTYSSISEIIGALKNTDAWIQVYYEIGCIFGKK